LLSFAQNGIGWRGRRLLLIATVRVRDPEVVLGVLIVIFGSDMVVADCGFPRERDISLENLMGAAADLNAGATAVEGLASLWRSLSLLGRTVAAVATAGRRLARSCDPWDS
jgi:hypothetical protein